jgi:O-antigen ligase
MKISRRLCVIFLIGTTLSCILISPGAVDYNLTIRSLVLAITLVVAFFFLVTEGVKKEIQLTIPLFAYAGFVLISVLSVFWSTNSSEALYSASRELLGLYVFLFAFYLLRDDQPFFQKQLLKISILISAVSVVIGSLQLLDIHTLAKPLIYAVTGLNAHKNLFSSFLFLNLFFLICSFRFFKNSWKIAAAVCSCLNVIFILLLQTKAVWFSVCLSAIIFLLLLATFKGGRFLPVRRLWWTLAAGVLFTNLFFVKIFPELITRSLTYIHVKSSATDRFEFDDERLMLWEKTYTMIKNHPFGVGSGNWQINFPDATLNGIWRAEDLNVTFQRPHNDWLWIFSETGIVGLNLYLLFVFSILLFLWRAGRSAENRKDAFPAFICISFICGYLFISFFDFPEERIEHNILVNIIFAFAYNICRNAMVLPSHFTIRPNKAAFLTALFVSAFVAILCYLRYSGEKYTREMYNAVRSADHPRIIKEGSLAASFAYNLDPTSVPIKWYIGNAQAALRYYDEALESFEKSYKANPYNRNVLNDLASACELNGQRKRAMMLYREASRISPRFDDPKLNLAALYISEKNYGGADSCLKSLFHDSERRTNYQRIVDARP